MKTLVLNTLGNDYTEQIKALIKDKEIEIVDTSSMKIAHCMGCNQCWLKTPRSKEVHWPRAISLAGA